MQKMKKMKRSHFIPILITVFYLLLVHWSMGLRPEHPLLIVLILGCYYVHPKSRRFVLDFLPFVLFGALYDFLRIYPKSWAGPIQVVWPHRLELALFGFSSEGVKLIPSDFFRFHHHPLLDLITGLTYSLHMIVPLGFALTVWVKNEKLARQFIWAFFLVNLLAFVTYIALPVAPPWYIELYGFTPADWSTPSFAAGLVRFDQLIGTPYFQGVYAKNAWVFGAIPSMHGGFPLLVILFAHKILRKGLIPLYGFMILVWFSAVYLRHHYVIDLASGVLYVVATFWFTTRIDTCRLFGKTPSRVSAA